MSSSEPSQMFLHYRVVDKIGSGGMGEVFKAEDTKLGRTVALKLLPATANDNATAKRRFLKEAQAASALNHPNIVTIHAIEEADGVEFIVMEFIEGQTLKAMIEREGALPLANLLDIGIQVCDALGAAHEIGLVHRDVKAANLVVTPRGRAKVLDFGLAKIVRTIADGVDGEALTLMNLTGEGAVLGTAFYMSPEQTRGETLDARSDIFSLGCVLYEAATRSLPFTGPSILAVMHAIATTDPAPPSRVRPDLPREFDLIVERALAKDKERRYASVDEMGEALRSLRASLTGQWTGVPIVYDKDLIESPANAFVGREPELRKLEEFLEQAIAGTGRVVSSPASRVSARLLSRTSSCGARAHVIRGCSFPGDAASSNTAPARLICLFSTRQAHCSMDQGASVLHRSCAHMHPPGVRSCRPLSPLPERSSVCSRRRLAPPKSA